MSVSKLTNFSQFRALLKSPALSRVIQNVPRNMSSHGPRTFPMQPTKMQWHKFKDTLHFFIMVGALPLTAILFYANVFIGPATLSEIPEGHHPNHWEYHRHPISRFIARYIYTSPQQEYEKMCHYIFEEQEKIKLRKLEAQIRSVMAENQDYQAYYYKPATAKYHRVYKQVAEELEALRGDID